VDVNTLVSTTLAGARPLGMRGEPLHMAHDQIRSALRRRLGERYARLLAEPQPHDGGWAIDWYTAATGPVLRLADLPAMRQQALLDEIDGLLGDIEALARRFGESDNEDARLLGEALRLAVRRPSDDYLFLVGDQPVIVCWGYEPETAGASRPPAFIASPASPAGPPDAAAGMAAGSSADADALQAAVARRRARRRLWASSVAATFLVTGGVWAMSGFPLPEQLFPSPASDIPPPPAPVAVAVPELHVRLTAALTQSRARGAELSVELASLREQVRRELELCRAAPAPPPPPEPPRPDEVGTPSSTDASLASAQSCPPPRKRGMPPPEVTIVLDGSASMNMPSGLSAEQEDGLNARSRRGDRAAAREIKMLLQTPGPKRIDDIKQAALKVIPALPPDVRVGYVVFDDCRAIQDFGFFAAGDRARLIALIQDKAARGGTPLARALETAGNGLHSPNGVIVVFSDGRDTCGGNVCAVAQRLHAAKPGVKAHIIDVTGSAGESTCLATITGGRIYSATGAQAALDALTDATASVRVPPQCRPRN
jgi:hypothetical protein